MKYRCTKSRYASGVLQTLAAAALTCSANAADTDFPSDALQGIEAMQRLPAEGFHVVQSKGQLLLVSTNGHYVISGGRLLDLWNQVELRSVADVAASSRIPLARMGINAKALGGFSAGREAKSPAVTVFLDPASGESRKLLPQLRAVAAQQRIDVVFIPAQPARAATSRALICDAQAARVFIEEGRLPSALPEQEKCGSAELDRARVTVQLLGIRTLPFSIASNGETVSGTPANFSEFVTRNQETVP